MAAISPWDAWYARRSPAGRAELATWVPFPTKPNGTPYFRHAALRWIRGLFVSAGRRDDALLDLYERQALAFVKRNLLHPTGAFAMERDFWIAARWMCYIAERGLTPPEAVQAIVACDGILQLYYARDKLATTGELERAQQEREQKAAQLDFHRDRITKLCSPPALLFLEYARLLARAAEVNRGLEGKEGGICFRRLQVEWGPQSSKGEVTARGLATVRAGPPVRLTNASAFYVTVGDSRMALLLSKVPSMALFSAVNNKYVLPLGDTVSPPTNVHAEIVDTQAYREAAAFNLGVLNTLDEYIAPEKLKALLPAGMLDDALGLVLSFQTAPGGWPTPTHATVLQ